VVLDVEINEVFEYWFGLGRPGVDVDKKEAATGADTAFSTV